MPHETGMFCVFTIHLSTMSHHFMQSYICRLHASLAVTCHLHFWQNDWDLLCATVVTQGVERTLKLMSQHRKLTLEKKILLSLLPGLEPRTFQLLLWRSNYNAISVPLLISVLSCLYLHLVLSCTSLSQCCLDLLCLYLHLVLLLYFSVLP